MQARNIEFDILQVAIEVLRYGGVEGLEYEGYVEREPTSEEDVGRTLLVKLTA